MIKEPGVNLFHWTFVQIFGMNGTRSPGEINFFIVYFFEKTYTFSRHEPIVIQVNSNGFSARMITVFQPGMLMRSMMDRLDG